MPKSFSFWDLHLGMRFVSRGTLKRIYIVREITGRKILVTCGEVEHRMEFNQFRQCCEQILED